MAENSTILELLAKATPGDWRFEPLMGRIHTSARTQSVCAFPRGGDFDAELICRLKNAITVVKDALEEIILPQGPEQSYSLKDAWDKNQRRRDLASKALAALDGKETNG